MSFEDMDENVQDFTTKLDPDLEPSLAERLRLKDLAKTPDSELSIDDLLLKYEPVEGEKNLIGERDDYSKPLQETTKATEYVLKGVIPDKKLTLFAGASGEGKTTALTTLLPEVFERYKVVLFSEDRDQIRKAMIAVDNEYFTTAKLDSQMATYNHLGIEVDELPTFKRQVMYDLYSSGFLQPQDKVVFIWDTLSANFSAEENSNNEMAKLIGDLMKEFGSDGLLWFIHHVAKGNTPFYLATGRGAGAITGNVHSVFTMGKFDRDDNVSYLIQYKVRCNPEYYGYKFTRGEDKVIYLDDSEGNPVPERLAVVTPEKLYQSEWAQIRKDFESKATSEEELAIRNETVRQYIANYDVEIVEEVRKRTTSKKCGRTALKDYLAAKTGISKASVTKTLDELQAEGVLVEKNPKDFTFDITKL